MEEVKKVRRLKRGRSPAVAAEEFFHIVTFLTF
jgi:hypothetical protein